MTFHMPRMLGPARPSEYAGCDLFEAGICSTLGFVRRWDLFDAGFVRRWICSRLEMLSEGEMLEAAVGGDQAEPS